MAAFGNTTRNDLIKYILQDIDPSWGNAANLYVSFHTANPGFGGSQTTSECAFGSYARATVARSAVGFSESGDTGANAAAIQAPECTSGSETVTHVAIGTASSGAGQIIVTAALNSPRNVSAGIQLQFNVGALTLQVT